MQGIDNLCKYWTGAGLCRLLFVLLAYISNVGDGLWYGGGGIVMATKTKTSRNWFDLANFFYLHIFFCEFIF